MCQGVSPSQTVALPAALKCWIHTFRFVLSTQIFPRIAGLTSLYGWMVAISKATCPRVNLLFSPLLLQLHASFIFSQWMTTRVLPRVRVLSFIFQTHWTLLLKYTRQDHYTPVLWPPAPSHWCDGVTSRGWPCAIFVLHSLISALLNTLTEWVFWRSCSNVLQLTEWLLILKPFGGLSMLKVNAK